MCAPEDPGNMNQKKLQESEWPMRGLHETPLPKGRQ